MTDSNDIRPREVEKIVKITKGKNRRPTTNERIVWHKKGKFYTANKFPFPTFSEKEE